ncbi:hypothetical protein JX265_009243 [Neoarthrinium moseri]|uniref:PH domain-containing protein n=1 Tax=Neoarthrinium moseri TaxID=1658444 RepID=A0A9P9WGR6_9PEZI|nr:hypothetical protein JX265_009243 [Neoarthrinium moseri]
MYDGPSGRSPSQSQSQSQSQSHRTLLTLTGRGALRSRSLNGTPKSEAYFHPGQLAAMVRPKLLSPQQDPPLIRMKDLRPPCCVLALLPPSAPSSIPLLASSSLGFLSASDQCHPFASSTLDQAPGHSCRPSILLHLGRRFIHYERLAVTNRTCPYISLIEKHLLQGTPHIITWDPLPPLLPAPPSGKPRGRDNIDESGSFGLGSSREHSRPEGLRVYSMAAVAGRQGQDVSHPSSPALRRRVSMEEDYFYQEIVTIPAAQRRLSQPPEYSPPMVGLDKHGELVMIMEGGGGGDAGSEPLPQYSCDVQLEGVFNMKMEIVDTIKRAPARNWRAVFVQLQGTKLSVYGIKKDWGLGKTGKQGATSQADNPPWIRKGTLEKTYTLLHADVGIAADYQKRRYVIRVRAETDQFLLSCIELETFVQWLDVLFAAINIAPALDERDFPRDQSIPRRARLQYFRDAVGVPRHTSSRGSDAAPRPAPVVHHSAVTPRVPVRQTSQRQQQTTRESTSSRNERDEPPRATARTLPASSSAPGAPRLPSSQETPGGPSPLDPLPSRLSTTSYPNEAVAADTGKWRPRHEWTTAHDMVYAKLCYSVLLFRSPRKSNYVIAKGKKWFVDWTTGRMIRVLPPGYFEHEVVGPWQVWGNENRRI